MKFAPVDEASITRAIAREFHRLLDEYLVCDAIVLGGGPSGLVAARDLAKGGFKTLVVENNNYLGGGFWIGGYLMNPVTFRAPAQQLLEELGIPYQWAEPGLAVSDGPTACSTLISAAARAGVRFLNMTRFEDLVVRNGRAEGVVVNWSPVAALPRQITCVDPVALEARVVVDATGHDAVVARSLERRGLLKMASECGPMDVAASEGVLVEKTGEIFPGLIVAGMAVCTVFGIPRMGPTFGGMLFSGRRAAEVARALLERHSLHPSPRPS
ncbi:MAG: sulfide-dependent adenosine diphosphate thiazole synthase [Kiritimatiellae bacterium]|nr:sulfide-dependent adenosine diphosphate thiazole synthase [Kiritimatiellia bacterium]